jgi:hypothetical protein
MTEDKPDRHILKNGGDHDGKPCSYTMCYSVDPDKKDKCLGWCREDKPDQPDFEKFFDDFVEAHSFRVPYDGSNKFYSDECIAACHKMKPDLKKAWTSHVLPVKEELKKKDEEMEGLIEIHHLQCEEVEKELSAVKEENKQLREKMEEKVKELTEVNDCYQRSMLNNRQLVGELKSELSKKGELINSDMLALLIEMQDSNYPGCNYSIPPLWKNKAKALIERAESTPLVKQSGDLWLIQRDGNSTEVFKNGERIEVPKDFDPLQLHLKTKSVEPVKSLQEEMLVILEEICETYPEYYDNPVGPYEYSCVFCSAMIGIKGGEPSVAMDDLPHQEHCTYTKAKTLLKKISPPIE